MPRPEMAWTIQQQIKKEMVSYKRAEGKELTAPACLRRLEEWAQNAGIPELIPTHAKTIQKKMTQFRAEGIYDTVLFANHGYGKRDPFVVHSLEQKFQFFESLGEKYNQIPWKYAGRAREITQLYLSTLRTEPEIGLIRQYIRVSQIDLEWTDVQQKAVKAEVFWAHELLKDVPDVDEGSTRYEELELIFRTWKDSDSSPQVEAFKTQCQKEHVVPWVQTVPAEMVAMLPLQNYIRRQRCMNTK
mgnify:CR=1 FL=1